jgi:hypothetical protein
VPHFYVILLYLRAFKRMNKVTLLRNFKKYKAQFSISTSLTTSLLWSNEVLDKDVNLRSTLSFMNTRMSEQLGNSGVTLFQIVSMFTLLLNNNSSAVSSFDSLIFLHFLNLRNVCRLYRQTKVIKRVTHRVLRSIYCVYLGTNTLKDRYVSSDKLVHIYNSDLLCPGKAILLFCSFYTHAFIDWYYMTLMEHAEQDKNSTLLKT